MHLSTRTCTQNKASPGKVCKVSRHGFNELPPVSGKVSPAINGNPCLSLLSCSVYLTNFWFALGFGIGAIGINLVLLYFPLLEGTEKSSFMAFVKDWRLRPLAMLAGFFCSGGNLAEFIGGQVSMLPGGLSHLHCCDMYVAT